MPVRSQTLTLYVSPLGRDNWSGLPANPNAGGDDGPLFSLDRARDAVRRARKQGHRGPVQVLLRGGVYRPQAPLTLTARDGGTSEGPVVWEAAEGERPYIDGSRALTGWRRARKPPPGCPAVARDSLWVTALPTEWRFRRLFYDGRELARGVSTTEDWRHWPRAPLADGSQQELQLEAGQLPKADDCRCAELNFLPTPYTFWSNTLTPVQSLDLRRRRLTFHPVDLIRPDVLKDIPFRLENVASGLTEPGRWHLDWRAGMLYLWSPDGKSPENHSVTAPYLDCLLRVQGSARKPVAHLHLQGLTFRNTRQQPLGDQPIGFEPTGAAVELDRVVDCRVERCRLTGHESWAMSAGTHAENLRIEGCEVTAGGAGGIHVTGEFSATGDFPTHSCRISDCVVHDCGRHYLHSAGIALGRTEHCSVRHCLIHTMPYAGIVVGGGARHTYFRGWPRSFPELERLWQRHGAGEPTIDAVKRFQPGHNRIEKNIVHHVMQRLDDGAAIYCHAGHHEEVCHNRVYAVESPFGMGLYFDDEQMDSLMEGNLVYRCPDGVAQGRSACVHLHHNGRNRVRNNVLIGGGQVLSIPNGYGGHVLEHNLFVHDGQPDFDRADPVGVTHAGDGRRQADWLAGPSRADNNLWWSQQGTRAAQGLLQAWQALGYGAHGLAADPDFADPHRDDYAPRNRKVLEELGMKPLQVDDAGPRAARAAGDGVDV